VTKELIETTGRIPAGASALQRTPRTAQRYLIDSRGRRCEICSRERWRGEPIPLVLDHINGNASDWAVTNLRLVCPNCDAQLPTFKNRNRGKGRSHRRKPFAAQNGADEPAGRASPLPPAPTE
jgi:hypothetical protein